VNYGLVLYLLEETIDSLNVFVSINCYKFSFPEIAFGILHQLKKILKNIIDKTFKENIKNLIEKITKQSNFIELSRKSSGINLLEGDKIKGFEIEMKRSKECILLSDVEKIKKKKSASLEARNSQMNDQFIEVLNF